MNVVIAALDPGLAGMASAVISVIGLVIVGLMTRGNSKKVDAVHVLVDGRLTQALDGIEALQARVEELGGEPAPPQRERIIEDEKP